MIPDDEVERVRQSADIVAVIGEHVQLRRMGGDYRGPCPFHQGTHRNFSVSPRKGMYYCFVCHEGGDVFAFLQKKLGVDWPSAVRQVASKSGIELREISNRQSGPDPRTPIWEANAAAAGYFRRVLWQDESAQAAREYLAERVISREIAERFNLGFAPRAIGLMRAHLNTLGIDDAVQLEAGLLARRSEEEEPRPRFRYRLIFPILDPSGRHVGFGGRVIGPGEPKYLNSPETSVFSKGSQLYNLNDARLGMRKDDRAFVVEGYFDVIRLVAAGVEEVVAPLGTALTDDQARLITRFTKNILLCYDSDKAGLRATFRSGDALLRHSAAVRVVSLPRGEDPDTFVRKSGARAFGVEVDKAVDVFERRIQILERGGWFSDLQKRRKAIDYLLPTIRAVSDPVMREIYLTRAAEVSGVDRNVLIGEAAGERNRGRLVAEPARATEPTSGLATSPRLSRRPRGPGISAEESLIRCMLQDRLLVERLVEQADPEAFEEPRYREIYSALLAAGAETGWEELSQSLSPEAVAMLNSLLQEPDAIQNPDRTINDSLGRLEQRRLENRNRELDSFMRTAVGAEQDVLLAEKSRNQREITRLREQRETR
ncbi:MAG: DNA primase [Gemmatimonadota bacterium]